MSAALRDSLDEADFASLMARQGALGRRLAVAVSGGADSSALLLLLAGWCKADRRQLLAVTVDHGLRRESAAEAQAVAGACKDLGVAHRTLVWRGKKPKTGKQEAARSARYRLLHELCLQERIDDLFLAHHAEDQAETLVMRLLSGSGYEGLAAMPEVGCLGSVRLRRPLLSVHKQALEALLTRAGLSWVEDPTNADRAFLRTQLRGAKENLPAVADLWADAQAFGRLRATSDRLVAALFARAADLHPGGYAGIDQSALIESGAVVGPRALAHLLQGLGGAAYPPAGAALERLWARLPLNAGETLSGCQIALFDDRLLILREAARLEPLALAPGRAGFWDRRYEVICGPELEQGLSLAPLGQAGIAALRAGGAGAALERVPGLVRPALPALFSGDNALHALFLEGGEIEKPFPGLEIRYIAPQLFTDACFTVADP